MGDYMVHTLPSNTEYRVPLAKDETVKVELINGNVEIFGSEISQGVALEFDAGKDIVFYTFEGCVLKIFVLEKMRDTAILERRLGPRIMITGGPDTGKSTVCQILLNYAARAGRQTIFVNTDTNCGDIVMPNTVSALIVNRPSHYRNGFCLDSNLMYHYGHGEIKTNPVLYEECIKCMGNTITQRERFDPNIDGGVLINTGREIAEGDGLESLLNRAKAFHVDIIVVLGNAWLEGKLKSLLPPSMKIISLPKSSSSGLKKSDKIVHSIQSEQIHQYFYGINRELGPHSVKLSFYDVNFYKVLVRHNSGSGNKELEIVPIEPTKGLEHGVFTVSNVPSGKHPIKSLISEGIAGFVLVTDVHMDKRKLLLISPSWPFPVSKPSLLLTDLQFMHEG